MKKTNDTIQYNEEWNVDMQVLSDICEYRKEKITTKEITLSNYIFTENLMPNKGGIVDASSLPTVEKIQFYQKGDVLVSNIRPYFKKIWLEKESGGCSNDILVFKSKEHVDSLYLYYVLSDDSFFDYATATSKGTKMPRGDKNAIMQYNVPKFNIAMQRKIGSLLKSIDNKIEINKMINRNLSEQCDAIYRDQFITKSHSSWTTGYLSDLITVKYGKDHKKLEDGDIPCYGSGGVMRYVERPIYDHESVLIPRKGTLNNVMYVNVPFWSVDTMFYTAMKISNVAKFVYHFVKGKDLASMNAGSAVPSMTVDILNAMELQIPSSTALAEFETIVQPLYKAMKDNEIENKKLAELRDTLLPKLMSGELDVSDLDI